MLEHASQSLSHFLQAHHNWGAIIAFLIAFIESLAIVGTIVPGAVTMTAIGLLIGRSIISFWPTFIMASLGAFLGDLLGYWIGVHYNVRLREMWPFTKYPKWLCTGEKFFKKHGGKSILIGRFIGPLRSVIPMIAGLLDMRVQRFLIASIPSASLWAFTYMLPGILIGALSMQFPPSIATKFFFIFLLVVGALTLFAWLIKYIYQKSRAVIYNFLKIIWLYLSSHKQFNWFTRTIAIKAEPENYYQLGGLLLVIFFGLLFWYITWSVLNHGKITDLNIPTFELLRTLRQKGSDLIMIGITELGDNRVLLTGSLLLFIWFIWEKNWREAVHWVATIALAIFATTLFKHLLYTPRPTGLLHPLTSSSYPSGHTFLSMMYYGFLATLVATHLKKDSKIYPYYVAATLIGLVGLSRLYLGVHWLTDILGSICFGIALVSLITLSYRRLITSVNVSRLLIAICVATLTPWAINFFIQKDELIKDYTLLWPSTTIQQEAWWGKPNPGIPFYRMNRLGKPVEPLNIQWLGNAAQIKSILISQGWAENPRLSHIKVFLTNFSPSQNVTHPLFPELYQNKPPRLIMIKNISYKHKLVLRLWDSNIHLAQDFPPLYVGNITHYRYHPSSGKIEMHFNVTSEFLPYLARLQWKLTAISPKHIPIKLKRQKWDGQILQISAPQW